MLFKSFSYLRGLMSERSKRILESWLDNAEAWTSAVRDARIESRRLGTDAAVVDAVLEQRPKRVLDAGCGEGWLARQLAESGVDVTGFDASAPLIDRAAEVQGIRFVRAGYEEFTHDPKQLGSEYDVVVFNFSLFEENILPVLRAAHSVLRGGGTLVLQTIHPFNDAGNAEYKDGWREENFATMGPEFKTAMPWYFRTMASWLRSVREACFAIEEICEPFNPATGRPLSLLIVATK